jgi:hypothetical protein
MPLLRRVSPLVQRIYTVSCLLVVTVFFSCPVCINLIYTHLISGSGSLVRLNDDDDLNLTQTAYAHKRVRVVQLLILGKYCESVYDHKKARAGLMRAVLSVFPYKQGSLVLLLDFLEVFMFRVPVTFLLQLLW